MTPIQFMMIGFLMAIYSTALIYSYKEDEGSYFWTYKGTGNNRVRTMDFIGKFFIFACTVGWMIVWPIMLYLLFDVIKTNHYKK